MYNYICNFFNCFKSKDNDEEHTCKKTNLNNKKYYDAKLTNQFLYTENPIHRSYTKTKI